MLEHLCAFAKTGIYPRLFDEKEICFIANEISPNHHAAAAAAAAAASSSNHHTAANANKRTERTLIDYNTFVSTIQQRVHVVISLNSSSTDGVDVGSRRLLQLMSQHSLLFTEFYVDLYGALSVSALQAIARFHLSAHNELRHCFGNGNGGVGVGGGESERESVAGEARSTAELHFLATAMVDMHTLALDHYTHIYSAHMRRRQQTAASTTATPMLMLARPFDACVFQSMSLFFVVYMRRIRERENNKLAKLKTAFDKLQAFATKLAGYDNERMQVRAHLDELHSALAQMDARIGRLKEAFRLSVLECNKEEALVNEMAAALDKLKHDVNKHDTLLAPTSNNANQQQQQKQPPNYELALAAIGALSEHSLTELKSYRAPPASVVQVVDALCLMFGCAERGWEAGKLLLMRPNFIDDLVYYDKKHMPDDIFAALAHICGDDDEEKTQKKTKKRKLPTAESFFQPELVAPASQAAASLCEWIVAVYACAKYERTIGAKANDVQKLEALYNDRLRALGEKRIASEYKCQLVELECDKRRTLLAEIKRGQRDLVDIERSEEQAASFLQHVANDKAAWSEQYESSLSRLRTHRMDALLAAAYMCYASAFDAHARAPLVNMWVQRMKLLGST